MTVAPTFDTFVHPLSFAVFAVWWLVTLYCVAICQRHPNIPVEYRQWYNLLVLITGPWGLGVLLTRYRYPLYKAAEMEYQEQISGGPITRFFRRLFGLDQPTVRTESVVELCTADGKPLGQIASAYGKRRDVDSESVMRIKSALYEAVDMRATDVLIDPRAESQYSIRFRIDGVLEEFEQSSEAIAVNMLNCLKIASRMDIAERRRPQDGSFMVRLPEADINCRLATTGTLRGPKAAIRLLDRRVGLKDVTELGLSKQDLQRLLGVTARKSGMLLVCGPTGSGKTTTLYALLNQFDRYARNLVTVEDPIEYPLEHATQTEVNEKAGITFSKMLRSILRQNPDVIFIGEVRDNDTAELALQASNTGHLVLTTVHGNDSSAAVLRLRDLGIAQQRLSGAVTAVLSQRLIRKLCEHCREPAALTGEDLELAMNHGLSSRKVFRAEGCELCRGTGYMGREGVFELLFVNRDVNECLSRNPSMMELRDAAIGAGMVPMFDHGIGKVAAGITTFEEVRRACEAG